VQLEQEQEPQLPEQQLQEQGDMMIVMLMDEPRNVLFE